MGISKLKNCKKCNRLFSSADGSTLCSRCNEDVDDEFKTVREYIYDNPSSSLKDISDGTGVNTESILKWIREGKIILSDSSSIRFCERCGEPVMSGRYCNACISQLQSNLKIEDKSGSQEEKQYRGMHIKDSKDK